MEGKWHCKLTKWHNICTKYYFWFIHFFFMYCLGVTKHPKQMYCRINYMLNHASNHNIRWTWVIKMTKQTSRRKKEEVKEEELKIVNCLKIIKRTLDCQFKSHCQLLELLPEWKKEKKNYEEKIIMWNIGICKIMWTVANLNTIISILHKVFLLVFLFACYNGDIVFNMIWFVIEWEKYILFLFWKW